MHLTLILCLEIRKLHKVIMKFPAVVCLLIVMLTVRRSLAGAGLAAAAGAAQSVAGAAQSAAGAFDTVIDATDKIMSKLANIFVF